MKILAGCALGLLFAIPAFAQNDRDTAVRQDRRELSQDDSWVYDDLGSGLKEAARTRRPLMIVFR